MKKALVYVMLVTAVLGFSETGFGQGNLRLQEPMDFDDSEFVPGQIIVQFKRGIPDDVITKLNEKNKAKVVRTSQSAGFKVLQLPENVPPHAMANRYAKNPNVQYAELNYVAHAHMVPNDSLYNPYQWHLKTIGMEQAWDIATGSGAIVAVVDSGVSQAGNDTPSSFTPGYDFVNGDSDPTDDNGHGTHVAGTIAQSTDNGTGVAGVAFGCSIMPVKVLNKRGSGSYADIAEGIMFAADNDADVINMSLGGSYPSETLELALEHAYNSGVTIVCSSGNDGATSVGYPAAYDDYCIAVGATGYDGSVAPYSNGGTSLDLVAPGGDTSVDLNDDGYGDGVLQETFQRRDWGYYFFQGTSMAAPHVAGVAALLIAQGDWTTPDEVRNRLQSTATDEGDAGWDSWYGHGIVNAAAALAVSSESPTLTIMVTPAEASIEIDATQVYTASGTYSDDPDNVVDLTSLVDWTSIPSDVAEIDSSGVATGKIAGVAIITATLDGVSGTATLTVTSPPASKALDVTCEFGTMDRFAGRNIFVTAFANIKVEDGSGNLLEGANVTGEWSVAVSGLSIEATDAEGMAYLTSPEVKLRSGSLEFRLQITVQMDGFDDYYEEPVFITYPLGL